ncbi:MAG TPA: hypothetical protein VHN80_04825 [Kineosporiaceae bacterium]|nr:hypothetical protein [Kineosporiaceae bacterium]
MFLGRGGKMGVACCVVVAAALTAACSGRSSEGGRSPAATTATVVPTSFSTAASPSSVVSASSGNVRAVAVEVYLAMWADMVEAGKTADFQSPRLARHAASQAWQLLYGGLRSAHQDGVVLRGEPTFAPQATGAIPAASPVAVSLVDCMDSTHWREYLASGQLKDNKPGGKHRATATVGLLDGIWKVTRLHVEDVGTCT